ncbi:hypothetical protein ABPG74_021829 [Tetrahymena malaccensis]
MTGKKYLNIDLYYVEYYQDQINQFILPTQDCSNVYSNWKGYTCIDFKNVSDQIRKLIYSNKRQSGYEIRISSCDGVSNCSSKEETMNVLTNKNTNLNVIINTQQFNYTSSLYQQNFIEENYMFDDKLVFLGGFYLQKTTSYISKGLLFQDKQQKDHLANYQRQDYFVSRNNIQQKIGFDAYGLISFQVDQNFEQQEFQFPMITEVLSQFFSLVNILVALGVVASKFSKNLILQNLCVLYLKEQFKCTAAQIIQTNQQQPPTNKNCLLADEVIDLQEKINQTDFLDRDKHQSIYQKLKKLVLKIFKCKFRNSNQDAQDKLNKKIKEYTLEQLDILQLYKQLIKLNMAIKLILTKDQYAALQFCGCNLDSQKDNLQMKFKLENQKIGQTEQKQDQSNQQNINSNQNQAQIQNQKQNQEVLNDLCISPQNQECDILKDNKNSSSNQTSQQNLSILNKHNSQKCCVSINLHNKNNELVSNQFDKSVDQEVQLFESDLYKFQDENDSQIKTKANKYFIKQNQTLNNEMKFKNTEQKPPTIMKINFLESYICSRDQEFKGDQSLQTYGEQDKATIGINIEQKSSINKEKEVTNKQVIYQKQVLHDNQINNFEKKIDQPNLNIFQQQFTFQFGKSNIQNSTFFGGFLTAFIAILSTVYLGYLLNLYFENKLLPKVTLLSQTSQGQQEISLSFEQSPFLFQFIMNGQLIEDFQEQTGKKYLNIDLYYTDFASNYTNQYILPTQDCSNVYSDWKGYTCIDFNNANDQVKQIIYSGNGSSGYEIRISSCDGASNCTSKEETMNMLTNQNTMLTVIINTQQYNYSSSQFQQSFITENYQFDDQLVFQGGLYLKMTTSYITKGLIFQDKQQKNHLANYLRSDYFLSRSKIEQKIGFDAYGQIVFQVDQNFEQQEIQFPMITEVLSQFFSLVNILMALGVVVSKFSKKLILQNLCVLYLKEQFKCTAAQLVQKNQKYPVIKNQNISFTNEVIDLQEKINQTYFFDREEKLSFYKKFKKFILKIFRINTKNSNQEAYDILNKKIMKYTLEQLDILQLYKQLIKLNMAIKLILTKDQYAALQFCGCSLDIQTDAILENQKINQIDQKQQQTNQSNINNNQKKSQEMIKGLCIQPQKQQGNLFNDDQKSSQSQTSQLNLNTLNNQNSQKDIFSINLENKNNELISNQIDKSVDQEGELLESDLFSFQQENYSQIQTKTNNNQMKQNGMFNNEMKIKNTCQRPASIMKLNFLKSYICSRDQEFKGDQSLQTQGEQDKITEGMNSVDLKSQINKQQTDKNKKSLFQNQTLDENQFNNIEKNIIPSNSIEQEQQITNEAVKQLYDKDQNEQIINNTNLYQNLTDNGSKNQYQNHIEELNKLDNDQLLLQQEFYNFIAKFKNNNSIISEIDKNIQKSIMIKNTPQQF